MRRLFAGVMIATLCTSASLAETVTITIDNSYGKNLMRITVADGEVERTPVRRVSSEGDASGWRLR